MQHAFLSFPCRYFARLQRRFVRQRPCLHGVGEPRSSGVGFFCFVFPRAWKQKKTNPTRPGSPTPCKQALSSSSTKFVDLSYHALLCVDVMKALQRLVALNALGCSLIWCRWQTTKKAVRYRFSFNLQIAHMRIFSSEHFKNSLLLYCMGCLFGKKVNSQFA